jgi:hypothetical protein
VKNSPTLGTSSSYIASTLRKGFQVLFVNCVPNTPVGCTDVNPFELIKLKGNLAFPKKPKSPSGLLRGAPPRKNGPFFHKNSRTHQVRFDLSLEKIQKERGQPSGKDTRIGDSLRLQLDTSLLPRLWTSGPLVKSNLSTSNSPKQRKGIGEQCDKRNKSFTSIYKIFKQIVVHYMATWP